MPLRKRDGHLGKTAGGHLEIASCATEIVHCESPCSMNMGSPFGPLGNNLVNPLSFFIPGGTYVPSAPEEMPISTVSTVTVELEGIINHPSTVFQEDCDCGFDTGADCGLVCGPDNILHQILCGGQAFGDPCFVRCLGQGPDSGYPDAVAGAVAGEPCIYDNTTGLGSRPGLCEGRDDFGDISICCLYLNRAYELPRDGLSSPEGLPCYWETLDQKYCLVGEGDECCHGHGLPLPCGCGQRFFAISAWVSKNWYSSTPLTSAPFGYYWFVMWQDGLQVFLYRSITSLPFVTDHDDPEKTCYDAAGSFSLELARAYQVTCDGACCDPHCLFPDSISLEVTRGA